MTIQRLSWENQENNGWKSKKVSLQRSLLTHISTQIESCCDGSDKPRDWKKTKNFKEQTF